MPRLAPNARSRGARGDGTCESADEMGGAPSRPGVSWVSSADSPMRDARGGQGRRREAGGTTGGGVRRAEPASYCSACASRNR
ncbi:hypothetical protein ACFSEO_11945 [Agromyces cerinus subsp. nitratus]|uniref:hypothetical protein n=1 Tax=Agromyces cerinus TaxID=33878 RepID=UPI003643DF68